MFLNILKWLGTAFTVGGALLTAQGIDPWNVYSFNTGAVLWLIAAIRMKDPALIAVNGILLTIYAYGAIIRLS